VTKRWRRTPPGKNGGGQMERPDPRLRAFFHFDCCAHGHSACVPLLRVPHRAAALVRESGVVRHFADRLSHAVPAAGRQLLEGYFYRRRRRALRARRGVGA